MAKRGRPKKEPVLGDDDYDDNGEYDPISVVVQGSSGGFETDIPVTRRMEVEAELGRLFLREAFRARRGKRKFPKYIHMVKPYIETIVLTMQEEQVSPVEAFFLVERDRLHNHFNLQWMMCALVELIEPSDPDMVVRTQQELSLLLDREMPQTLLMAEEIRQPPKQPVFGAINGPCFPVTAGSISLPTFTMPPRPTEVIDGTNNGSLQP